MGDPARSGAFRVPFSLDPEGANLEKIPLDMPGGFGYIGAVSSAVVSDAISGIFLTYIAYYP